MMKMGQIEYSIQKMGLSLPILSADHHSAGTALIAHGVQEDSDEKFLLQSDLEGDFIANAPLKKIYRRIFGQPVKYNVNFTKTLLAEIFSSSYINPGCLRLGR